MVDADRNALDSLPGSVSIQRRHVPPVGLADSQRDAALGDDDGGAITSELHRPSERDFQPAHQRDAARLEGEVRLQALRRVATLQRRIEQPEGTVEVAALHGTDERSEGFTCLCFDFWALRRRRGRFDAGLRVWLSNELRADTSSHHQQERGSTHGLPASPISIIGAIITLSTRRSIGMALRPF